MIKKIRKIALGTVAIAAAIALFATGPEVAQVWSQTANAQYPNPGGGPPISPNLSVSEAYVKEIVNKAIPLFGVDLPLGKESPTFIQNVTQLAKEGFDSPENAKLFLQMDSIALNSSSSSRECNLNSSYN